MKKLFGLLMFFFVFTLNAQNFDVDYKEGLERAQKENKKVLLYFTGSDWCFYCKKMDKRVFNTDEFKAYAKENLILTKVDFPKKKKNQLDAKTKANNIKIAKKYGFDEKFPTFLVLDFNGKVLKKLRYTKSSKEFIAKIK